LLSFSSCQLMWLSNVNKRNLIINCYMLNKITTRKNFLCTYCTNCIFENMCHYFCFNLTAASGPVASCYMLGHRTRQISKMCIGGPPGSALRTTRPEAAKMNGLILQVWSSTGKSHRMPNFKWTSGKIKWPVISVCDMTPFLHSQKKDTKAVTGKEHLSLI